jgi:hypothetical protein
MSVLSDRLKKKESSKKEEVPVSFELPSFLTKPQDQILTDATQPIKTSSRLGQQLDRIDSARLSTPSYYSQYQKVTGQEPLFSLPPPKQEFNLRVNALDLLKQKDDERIRKELTGVWGGNNPLTKFLIGRGTKAEDLGRDRGYFSEKIPERGVLGFLTGDLLKSDNETAAELYQVFVRTGMDPDEAFRKANDSVIEGKAVGLSEAQRDAYLQWDKWEKIGVVLDSVFLGLDVFTLGGSTALKTGVKSVTRSAMRSALQEVAKTGDRVAIRDVLLKQYPTLKASEQLEEMIDIVQKTPDNFSWLRVRSEFRNSSLFKGLAETEVPTLVNPATEAQRGLFRQGVPLLKTVEGGVGSVIDARKAITSVLRGEREAERLSNPSVFLSEVKAGALARGTEIGDKIDVFLLGGRGRVGKQVTLSKELAKDGADTLKVSIDDLVRLPDGTFAVVPKKQLGRDLTPSIRAIKDSVVREAVSNKEAQEAVRRRLQETVRNIAARKAKQEAAEKAAREEAVRLAQTERLIKAREAVEAGRGVTKALVSKLQKAVTRASGAIAKQEKQITRAVQHRASLLRASTEKAGLTAGRFIQKFGEFMTVTEKKKLQSGKSLTLTDRRRIQKRIRDSFDKEISTLRATKDTLQQSWREAGSALEKAKSRLKEAEGGKKFLQEAKRFEEVAKKSAQTEKVKVEAVKANTEFTQTFKDNFIAVTKEVGDTRVVKSTPVSTQPLKGTGVEVVNKVAKGIQAEADDAFKAVGVKGGLKSVQDGTAKINAETLEKLSMTHRVAGNTEQLKSAIIRVGRDPEKAYFDFITSNAMDDSMAALYSALIRSDFIRGDVNRLNNLVRHFDKFSTRTAQELQAHQLIGKLDYPNIISRMMRKADEVMKKRNINIADEVIKAEKLLGDEFDKLIVLSKSDVLDQLDKVTCKI